MIVAMAVITTMAMPPTLRWALARMPMRKDEKQRLEREEMEARGFVPNLERLLLAVDDSANGAFASRIAGMLAGTGSMPTTVLHITDPAKIDKPTPETKAGKDDAKPVEKKADAKKTAEEDKADKAQEKIEAKKAKATGETVKEAAAQIKSMQEKEEKVDTPVDVTTIVHESPHRDFIIEEAKKGYDLMLIGLAKASDGDKEFHESVAALAMGFKGPLAVAATRGELAGKPNGKLSILVPVNGTEASRRGAEVAITMARATKAPVTVLYVAMRTGKRAGSRVLRNRGREEAILKDIVAIADGYNMSIRTALLADNSTDDAILGVAKRRKNNLIVLGVGRRPGEKLFFGETAAALLKNADCSLLFVAS